MPKPMPLAANAPAQRTRRLLAAAMAAPALFQMALHGLAPLLPFGQAGAGAVGQVLAYAASGAAAVAGCVLVARLEAARSLRTGRKPVRED